MAQQRDIPIIGYLGAGTSMAFASRIAAFRQGISSQGLIEGQSVNLAFRWADNQAERLVALARELVDSKVSVIAAPGGAPAALAARQVTSTIPIVFEMGADPDKVGLVHQLNRPEANITGVSSLNVEVSPKRLDLLLELLPSLKVVGALLNPASPTAGPQERELRERARVLGLELHLFSASRVDELEAVFASLGQTGAKGLVIASDGFFATSSEALANLAKAYSLPAIHQSRDFAAAGGLLSYGGNFVESHRQAGAYAARLAKGERVADLPVQMVRQLEMFINLRAARELGMTVPLSLLGRADSVID